MTQLQELPTLVRELARRFTHYRDIVVPFGDLSPTVDSLVVLTDDGVSTSDRLALTDGRGTTFGFKDQALPQLCGRIGPKGSGQTPPASYMDALCADGSREGLDMAVANLEFWLERTERVVAGLPRQLFVRLVSTSPLTEGEDYRTCGAQMTARAILSDVYYPIDNLDVVGAMVNALDEEQAGNTAAGARVVRWRVTDASMDIMLVNMRFGFDLLDPNAGLIRDARTSETGFMRLVRQGYSEPSRMVFPAARITNSETGGGGMNILSGLFEAACTNGSMLGHDVRRKHVGARMDSSARSVRTHEAKKALIQCEIADAVTEVFNEEKFLAHCRQFAALFNMAVAESDVPKVVGAVVRETKLPQAMIDDILRAYVPMTEGKHSLGDIQRAVTNLAHSDTVTQDQARSLEDAGGTLITMPAARQRALCSV